MVVKIFLQRGVAMNRVAIIGAGVLGTAVAVQLNQKGYKIVTVRSRRAESAQRLTGLTGAECCSNAASAAAAAEIVFLTVPDRVIAQTAEEIARDAGFRSGQLVIHMSGALAAGILAPAKEAGAAIVSLHPLQSFASVDIAIRNLPGSFYSLQGDPEGIKVAGQIVADLEGRSFLLPPDGKPLYHLGACIVSNYLVALVHSALSLYQTIGLNAETALEALLPLVKGTLANIEKLGPTQALTGPVARGDIATLEQHLEAMRKLPAIYEHIYSVLGTYTAEIALEKGTIDNKVAEEISAILRGGMCHVDR